MDFGGAVADPRVAATGASAVFSGLGRITQMVSQDGTSTYGYDAKSELTAATHTFQSNESFSYDNNGNRTMTGYQTGTDNRLTNDGTYSYTYDAEGNRLTRTKTATGEVTEYTWDYHNRLTKVTDKNSQGTVTQVVEYTYDVFGRRIGREVDTASPFDMADAAIERYVYDDIQNGLVSLDGGNVVLDFVDPDGSGGQSIALSKRYLYGEVVDQILAQEDLSKTLGDATRTLWSLLDNLGTVRDLAKQDGTIAVHYKYDSYGNVTSGDTSQTRYLFTAREFDTATDLQYNRARWLDPRVGRWISEDPIGFAAGDANVGRYVKNSPCASVDPSGLWVLPWHPGASWNPTDTWNLWVHGEDPNGQPDRGFDQPEPWHYGIGVSVTLPSIEVTSPYWIGGGAGHELVWIPGQGWKSYLYPQVGMGTPGGSIHVGVGLICGIANHDDYLEDYIDVGWMSPPTAWGSFGGDISFFPGSPTVFNFDWGLASGGPSVTYQYYLYTTELLP